MYATRIEDEVLNLAVSGKLWRRSLVMIDEETQTLWSQLLAKGMEGKHKGVELPILPSVITDWKSWKKSHPETTVIRMSRTGKEFRSNFYRNPEKFVVGLNRFKKAKAWPFDQLKQQPLVNDQFFGDAVVVYFVPDSSAAFVYDRELNGEKLEFVTRESRIVDTQTGSAWDLSTGKAFDGKHKGLRLRALPAIPSFKSSWMTFHPESEIWTAVK